MEILSIQILHFMFCFLLIGCAFCVSFSFNSVESVIFLILTFLNGAGLLFLFNVDFLGIVFIIIYVGAVAVLFLFVIMMLNVKNDEIGRQKHYKSAIIYSIFYLFLITLAFSKMNGWFDFFLLTREFFFLDFDCFSNLDVLKRESLSSNHTILINFVMKVNQKRVCKARKIFMKKFLKLCEKQFLAFFLTRITLFKNFFFKLKEKLIKKVTKVKGFTFNDWVSLFILFTLLTSGVGIFIAKNLPLIFRVLYLLNLEGSVYYYVVGLLFTLDDISLFCAILFMEVYLVGVFLIFSYLLMTSFSKNYSSFSLNFLVSKHLALLSDSAHLLTDELFKSKKKAVTADIFNTCVNVFLFLCVAFFLIKVFFYYA
jgi:hypothetical protein